MTEQAINNKLLQYLGKLTLPQKELTLNLLKSLFTKTKNNEWESQLTNEQQECLEIARKEIKAGKRISNDVAMRMIKEWS